MKESLKMVNDIFDSIGNVFDKNPNEHVESYPTTQEIRDRNYTMMCSALLSGGYKLTEHIVYCADGDEYEITEIRGPKASGFLFVHSYGAQTYILRMPISSKSLITTSNGEENFKKFFIL